MCVRARVLDVTAGAVPEQPNTGKVSKTDSQTIKQQGGTLREMQSLAPLSVCRCLGFHFSRRGSRCKDNVLLIYWLCRSLIKLILDELIVARRT